MQCLKMRRRHLVAAATLLAAAAPLTPGPRTTLTGRPRLAALKSAPANGAAAPAVSYSVC